MSRYISVLAITACSALGGLSTARAGIGEDTAKQMADYYSNTVQDCGAGRPAYLCSGLMLRGTEHSTQWQVWNPSPTSIKNKGVSFSYLRKDAKYDRLGLKRYNGYAVKPNDAPSAAGDIKLEVLCMFPLDAWTDNRDAGGCGDNSDTKDVVEQFCNVAGIDTAQKWADKFNSFKWSEEYKTARERSCAYDVKTTSGDAAVRNFNTSLEAMKLMGTISLHRQSEIRVSTWAQNLQDKLPIMAFIYTKSVGLNEAKLDQQDMYTKSANKRWIPVIKVTLPSTASADAVFEYNPQDQMIDPSRSANCGKYFDKAEWKTVQVREIGAAKPQLSITQTACAKNMTVDEIPKAMEELKAWRTADWPASRDKSVQAQLQCLRSKYPDAPTWNIEPFRPFVNAQAMNKAKCNPYNVPDEEPEEVAQTPGLPPNTPHGETPGSPPNKPRIETPDDILKRIMANYERIRTADDPCLEDKTGNPRGHYYCSGVLVRTVVGNFNPWDVSPSRRQLGSTSYSWIRADNSDSKLYHAVGFIVQAPADAVAAGAEPLDVGWQCLYPLDAGTAIDNGWNGCDFKNDKMQDRSKQLSLTNRNRADVYGSCAEVGVSTATEWTKFMNGKHAWYSCSWDPEHPQYWDAMIKIRSTYPRTPYFWNELLLKNLSNTGDNSKLIPHIDAFFYDIRRPNEGGLFEAKNMQYRMKLATGKTLPIFRLDFKASASERFSYVAADQSTDLCERYIEKTEWKDYTDENSVKHDVLYVTPTVCARKQAITLRYSSDKAVNILPAELARISKNDPQWSTDNEASMGWQAQCNMWRFRKAPAWLLEPSRKWPLSISWWTSADCDH